jgi:hypothetical protein
MISTPYEERVPIWQPRKLLIRLDEILLKRRQQAEMQRLPVAKSFVLVSNIRYFRHNLFCFSRLSKYWGRGRVFGESAAGMNNDALFICDCAPIQGNTTQAVSHLLAWERGPVGG